MRCVSRAKTLGNLSYGTHKLLHAYAFHPSLEKVEAAVVYRVYLDETVDHGQFDLARLPCLVNESSRTVGVPVVTNWPFERIDRDSKKMGNTSEDPT